MSFTEPEDVRLHGHLERLGPDAASVFRMQARVLEGYEARPRSLWREWLSLLSARPVVNTGWVAAAAVILFLTTPLGLLPRLLPLAVGAPGSAARERRAPGAVPTTIVRTPPTVAPPSAARDHAASRVRGAVRKGLTQLKALPEPRAPTRPGAG